MNIKKPKKVYIILLTSFLLLIYDMKNLEFDIFNENE